MMKTSSLEKEIVFRTSRSSGSGGQHVNKVSTKVELRFDIDASMELTDEQKACLLEKLRHRINQKGILSLVCQETRSQKRNKELVLEKFHSLLHEAFQPKKVRKKTKVSRSSKEKRLNNKRLHSQKKALRKKARTSNSS